MSDSIESKMPVGDPEPFAAAVVDEPKEKKTSKTGRRILAIILIILILLLTAVGYYLFRILVPAGSPTSDAGRTTWVRSIYGFGDTDAQLTNPAGIALDPSNGNFWEADPSKFRLVQYAPDGTFVSMIAPSAEDSGTAGARLRHPAEVAMDNDGLLYVAEPTYDVVRVFETDGTELGEFGVPEPLSLAVNDDYVVVGSNAGIAILDKEGNPVQVIGTNGKGEGQFDKVNGVAIDEDNVVYAADTFNNRISAWTVDGEQLWLVETGYPGNQQMTGEMTFETDAPAQMQLPMGMTLDANNRLIVADMYDFSFGVFDKETGDFITKYGEIALKKEDGKFFYPSDIDYDPLHDWFVVSDTGAKRAQIVRLPDSGGSLLARGRASLAGPLKACFFPLLLLIIVLVISFIVNRINRKKKRERLEAAAAARNLDAAASPVTPAL